MQGAGSQLIVGVEPLSLPSGRGVRSTFEKALKKKDSCGKKINQETRPKEIAAKKADLVALQAGGTV